MKRKICVFSGKRGGFGAYLPLMQLIDNDKQLELQIVLTDMHASKRFGTTVEEVKKYFPRNNIVLVKMKHSDSDTFLKRAENLGYAAGEFVKTLDELKPDIVFVHGDRGEHLMIAFAALNLNIPVAHTQGGELSGNIDNTIRYAITKIAHLHFPETKEAAERIIKSGEERWRVHVVGSLYIDRIVKKTFPSFKSICEKYNLSDGEEFFIFIMHPETYKSVDENLQMVKNTIEAMTRFNVKIIAVYPCSDPGYNSIIKYLHNAQKRYAGKIMLYKNIENLEFLSLMSNAAVMVGNSSSGFVEAPYFKLSYINIGCREDNRTRDKNVIDVEPENGKIIDAINYVLTNKSFTKQLKKCGYIFGDGYSSEKILKTTKNFLTFDKEKILNKRFVF